MSWSSEYNKLRKKRIDEEESSSPAKKAKPELPARKKANTSTKTQKNTKKSFEDEYMELRSQRADIAPVRQTVSTEKKLSPKRRNVKAQEEKDDGFFDGIFDGWFKSSESDVAKSILGTSSDFFTDLTAGIVGVGEKVVDSLAFMAPYASNAYVHQNGGIFTPEQQKQQEAIMAQSKKDMAEFISKDLYDEQKVAKKILSGLAATGDMNTKIQNGGYATQEDWDKYHQTKSTVTDYLDNEMEADSVLDTKSDSLVQSAGQLLATSAMAALGVPGSATIGATAFGSEAENALKEGATYEEAGVSASASALAEVLTEKISGGIKFGGRTLDEGAVNWLSKNIPNKIVRTLAKLGMDMTGEGAEEILSGAMSALGQKLTYADEKEFNELFSKEDAWESFIGGAVLGGVGSVSQAVNSSVNGVDSLTEAEREVVDEVYQEIIEKAEKEGNVSEQDKAKIYDDVLQEMANIRNSMEAEQEEAPEKPEPAKKEAWEKANEDGLRQLVADIDKGATPSELKAKSQEYQRERQQIQAAKPYGEPYTAEETDRMKTADLLYSAYDSAAKDPGGTANMYRAMLADIDAGETGENVRYDKNGKHVLPEAKPKTTNALAEIAKGARRENFHGAYTQDGKQYISDGSFVAEFNTVDESLEESKDFPAKQATKELEEAFARQTAGKYDLWPLKDTKGYVRVSNSLFDAKYVNAMLRQFDNPTFSISNVRGGHEALVVTGENGRAVLMPVQAGDNAHVLFEAEKIAEAPVAEETDMFPDNLAPTESEIEKLNQEREALEQQMTQMGETGNFDNFAEVNKRYLEVRNKLDELEKGESERKNSISDKDAPIEDAPAQGEAEKVTVDDPFSFRNYNTSGDRRVKAFVFENPEFTEIFQREANIMLGELQRTTKGKKLYNDELYAESGGTEGWSGQSRVTSDSIAELRDSYGMSYKQIQHGLEAIVQGGDAANVADAKKIEFMLNDRLLHGYRDFDTGLDVPPSEEYRNLLNERQFVLHAQEEAQTLTDADAPAETQAEVPTDTVDSVVDGSVRITENATESQDIVERLVQENRDVSKVDGFSIVRREIARDGNKVYTYDIRTPDKMHIRGRTEADLATFFGKCLDEIESYKAGTHPIGTYLQKFNESATEKADGYDLSGNVSEDSSIYETDDFDTFEELALPAFNGKPVKDSAMSGGYYDILGYRVSGFSAQNLRATDMNYWIETPDGKTITGQFRSPSSESTAGFYDNILKVIYKDMVDNGRQPKAAAKARPTSKLSKATPDSGAPVHISKDMNAPKGQTTMFAEKKSRHGDVARILPSHDTSTRKKFNAWAMVKEHIFDNGMVFEDLSKATGNRELEAKWNFIRNANAQAQHLIGKGNANTRALKDIRKEVQKSGKYDDFVDYMYHKHNVARMTLEQRGFGPNKPVFGDSVTWQESYQIQQEYEKQNPEFMEWSDDIHSYMLELRTMLVDAGIITPETSFLWDDMYPDYVPISRDNVSGGKKNTSKEKGTWVNAPVWKAKGGNQDIDDLFDTIGKRTAQTYRAIAKNSFGIELMETLDRPVGQSRATLDDALNSLDVEDSLLKKGQNGEPPTFSVFQDGVKVEFEISEEMYEALKPKSAAMQYRMPVVSTANELFRKLTTEWNPTFVLTNPIKDVQDIIMNSQHPVRTYAELPRSIWQQIADGKYYREYMENGGEGNSYFDTDKNLFKGDSFLEKMNLIGKVNNHIEMTPRLAEYIASREAGKSIEGAMLDAARVTTNFAAGGDVAKFANRNGCTFLNASIQGAVQQVRNVREAHHRGLMGYVGLAARLAVAGVPAVMLNHLMWDDDEEYENLADYAKQNYYIVGKYDDGKFIRIPKGRATAVIADAFEKMHTLATGDDEKDLTTFLDMAASNFRLALENLAPNNPLDNNIVAPIFQVFKNETWYGEELVTSRLQDLPKVEQFDEKTDSISIAIAEKVNELTDGKVQISPKQLNYLVNQYSGGVGDFVLPYFTPKAESGDDSFWGKLGAPFRDKFTTDSVLNSQIVTDFRDKQDELKVLANSKDATQEDMFHSMYMETISYELNDLYAQKREIQTSDRPDSEKYELTRELQQQINDKMEEALSSYQDVKISGMYAEVSDRRYNYDAGRDTWYEIRKKNADGSDNYYYQQEQKAIKTFGATPADYWNKRDDYDDALYYATSYGKNLVSTVRKVFGVSSFAEYGRAMSNLKADYDEDGNAISGSKKNKIIEYCNTLDADYGEKIILFKSQYPKDDTYNYDIIDYLNSREDLSYSDMKSILEELGFEVDSKGNIRWD